MILLSDAIRKQLLISESKGIDHILIICIAALSAIGFVMITSATLDYASQNLSNPFYFTIKTIFFIYSFIYCKTN